MHPKHNNALWLTLYEIASEHTRGQSAAEELADAMYAAIRRFVKKSALY